MEDIVGVVGVGQGFFFVGFLFFGACGVVFGADVLVCGLKVSLG